MPSVLKPSILIALTNTKTTAAHTHGFRERKSLMHWMAQNLFLNTKEIKMNINPIFMSFSELTKKLD